MAVLVAIALFVAQSINFAMLYQGRRQILQQQVVGPALTRIIDVTDRLAAGKSIETLNRDRIRISRANPIPASRHSLPDIEQSLRVALIDAGIPIGIITSDVRPIAPNDPRLERYGRRMSRFARYGAELKIAVELPGRYWLVLSAPWPRSDWPLLAQLIAQTLILYAVVLLPVLWGARRISRPLHSLASAARRFKPGEPQDPLDESGPQDVRAVITAFNALRLRVTAMLDEKDRMLGAIGHDLRTPLAALRVRIESVDDDDDRTRMADTIDEMNRTLDDILSLARLGRPSEGKTELDLGALVDAVVEDFVAIGSPVTFVETDRLTLALRPSLMRRAIRNLIENAVKYGKSAEVRLEASAKTVAISVADHGPGIPADKLETVFDAFTRLETSRNRDTGGSGLGLALARAIVRDAGGDITLANRADGGLNATITLPRGA
ncbi:MAG: HAMP domain-containing protein [Sphingomonas sp.]|nr:HAMP domain-containing protein [Sphingomonas sp.]